MCSFTYGESMTTVQNPRRKPIRLPRDRYREGHAFLVTINTHQKRPWFQTPDMAEAAEELLAQHEGLFAWCILPDHIHLLIEDADVLRWVQRFKGRLTPVFRRLNPGERLWQRSFHDRALRKEEDLQEAARYTWRNAVEAGLVECAGDYRWSGSTVWPEWRSWEDNGSR
jgi:putative transposase